MTRPVVGDEELAAVAFGQMISLFVMPEVQRRQASGSAENPFRLRAAQVLFPPHGRGPAVRLNDEVRAFARIRFGAETDKKPGDVVFLSEFTEYEVIQLPASEDPDSAHWTALRVGDGWQVAFDFHYNRGLARAYADAAGQFLRCAEVAYKRRDWRAFVDTLFSTVEVAAKARLLIHCQIQPKTRHGPIEKRFHLWAHLRNVDAGESRALKRLGGLRHDARYVGRDVSLDLREASPLLCTARKMVRELLAETVRTSR